MGGLLSCNFYFVVHTVCYCMDAICLNGNVWINIPLCSGKLMSGMTASVSVRSKGRGSFDTEVYISHIYTKVFNCWLALIRLYMHIYMYVWDVFTFG